MLRTSRIHFADLTFYFKALIFLIAPILLSLPCSTPAFAGDRLTPSTTDDRPVSRTEEQKCTVMPGNLLDCTVTRQTLIQTDEGARQHARAQLVTNEHYETMEIAEAVNIKADGRRLEVPADRIIAQPLAADGAADFDTDETVYTIIFPDVAVGDRLRYVYREKEKRARRPGSFNIANERSKEHDAYLLTLDVPARLKFRHAAKGFRHSKRKVRGHGAPDRVIHSWTLDKSFRPQRGPMDVHSLNVGPYIQITSYPDWPAAGKAFCSVAEPMAQPTPEIAALAADITRSHSSRKDKAQAIFDWVAANVRYVAISEGDGGYTPRPAPFVASHRYGDCKDHATLMIALLAAIGVDAEFALISADTLYSALKVPLEIFNHVIVYVPELGLYADSTADQSVFGALPSHLYDKPTLRCRHGRSGLARTPPTSADANTVTVEALVDVGADGTLAAETATTATGSFAETLRELMSSAEAAGLKRYAADLAVRQRLAGDGRIEPTPASPNRDPYTIKSAFHLRESILGEDNSATAFVGFRLVDQPFDRLRNLLPAKADENFVCAPIVYRERIAYRLPQGWAPSPLPRDRAVTHGFVDYSAHYAQRGDRLEIERMLALRPPRAVCPASAAADVRAVMRVALQDEEQRLTFAPAKGALLTASLAQAGRTPQPPAAVEDETLPYTERFQSECSVRGRNLIDCKNVHDIRIASQAAAEQNAEQQVTFNDYFDSVEIAEAANLKADGRRLDVAPDKIMTQAKSNGAEALYHADETVRTIIFPDAAKGDTLHYVVNDSAKRARVANGFGMLASHPSRTYRDGAVWSLDAPADLKLQVASKNFTQSITERDGRKLYSWSLTPVPVKPDEPLAVFNRNAEPFLIYSTYSDWNEAARVFCEPALRLSQVSPETTPEIFKLADEITQGHGGRREQAEAIFNWVVSKIAHVNVSLGDGVLEPTPPSVILANRYGDDKDLAVLTKALLAAKSIDADFVQLNGGSNYDQPPVPINYFIYTVLYIPELNIYIDPAEKHYGFGVLTESKHDKPTLRCDGRNEGALRRTPAIAADANSLTIKSQVNIDAEDGHPSGILTFEGKGPQAADLRKLMERLKQKGATEFMKSNFAELAADGAAWLEDARPALDRAEPYAIRMGFSLNANILGEDNSMPALSTLGAVSPPYAALLDAFRGDRASDFVCHPVSYRETIAYRIPPGWTLTDLPRNVHRAAGPAEFSAHYRHRGATLEVERAFTLRTPSHVCPAALAREMAPAFKAAQRDAESHILFVRVPDVTAAH